MDKALYEEILKNVAVEDMPNGDMRLVAECCGIETAVKLLQEMPGLTLYIPNNSFKHVIEKYIVANHRKATVKDLALSCGVTEVFVYSVIRRAKEEAQQMKLFPEGHHESQA